MRKFILISLVLILLCLGQSQEVYENMLNPKQNFLKINSCLAPNIQISNSTLQYLFSFQNFPSGHSLNTTVSTQDDTLLTKQILIEEQDGDSQSIDIVNFEQDSPYYNWIVNQYEERTLANYPYIATKVIINAMVAQREVFKDAIVLDAGSGDGSLSILSKKLGAKKVYGIESQKNIISIAEKNVRLNEVDDIEFINGNFILKHEVIDAPTVLLFNVGYVNQDIEEILENYPTIKYVFLTSQNLYSELQGQDFLSDLSLVKSFGKIKKAFYHRQEIYSMNAFDEGYWGFAVERDTPKAEIEFSKRSDVVIRQDISLEQMHLAASNDQYVLDKLKQEQFTNPLSNPLYRSI